MGGARLDKWIDALVVALPVAHWIFGRNQYLLHGATAACVVQLYREIADIEGTEHSLCTILARSGPLQLYRIFHRILPVPRFPAPLFPAHVGIRHLYWDAPDGKHRGADVFYPAEKTEGKKRHLVAGKHGLKYFRLLFRTQNKPFWLPLLLSHLTKVASNSFEGTCHLLHAPVAVREGSRRHPVVIFSPGLYGSPELYTYFCECLASMGMVVACVRHTDRSSNFIDMQGQVRHEYEHMTFEDPRRADQVHERVADVMDLVRHLEKTNKGEWGDKLDLTHMAVAGHSFGGSTVVRCLLTTDRFRCGLVLDGWFLPIAKMPMPEKEVFQKSSCLFILSPIWQPPQGLARIKRMCRLAPATWKPYFLQNSTHHAYDDFPLWLGTWTAQRLKMEHPAIAHEKAAYIVAETAFDFLAQTLPSSTPTPFQPTAPRPELQEISLEPTPPSSPRSAQAKM